jgi:hypothetical protein
MKLLKWPGTDLMCCLVSSVHTYATNYTPAIELYLINLLETVKMLVSYSISG